MLLCKPPGRTGATRLSSLAPWVQPSEPVKYDDTVVTIPMSPVLRMLTDLESTHRARPNRFERSDVLKGGSAGDSITGGTGADTNDRWRRCRTDSVINSGQSLGYC